MGETDHGQLIPVGESALVAPEEGDEIERIRASIELTRTQISHALEDVQVGVQEKLVWRDWVKEHPVATIGIAFGIGYLLGRV